MLKVFFGNTTTRVADKHLDRMSFVKHFIAVGNRALNGVLQRVTDEIREHLDKSVGIRVHRYIHGRLTPFQLYTVRTAELEQVPDACAEFIEVSGTLFHDNLTRLNTRQVENLIDKILQTVVVALDDLEIFHAFLLGVGLNDDSRETFDGVEGCADFMAHICKEKGLHLAGILSFLSLLLVFLQFLVCNRELFVG